MSPNSKSKRSRQEVGSSSRRPTIKTEDNGDVEILDASQPQETGIDDIPLFSPTERERFGRLKNRRHVITKFLDNETLSTFGLENGVRTSLRKGGMEEFLGKSADSYARLTVEFLCSLSHSTSNRGLGHTVVSFRLFGRRYSMTYNDIARAFGWEYREDPNWETPNDATIHTFWYNLTGQHYKEGNNRAIEIVIPAFRILYRCLAMTLFAQGEPSSVAKGELACLWALSPEGVGTPNMVDLWVKRMLQLQKSESGKLACGGMITLLALAKEVKIPENTFKVQSKAGCLLDKLTLRRLHYITYTKKPENVFWEITSESHAHAQIRLPPTPITFFDIWENDSTYDLLGRIRQIVGLGVPVRVQPQADSGSEEYVESEDEEYVPQNEGEDETRPWRQYVREQFESLDNRVTSLREELLSQQDRLFYDMQTQFSALISYGDAAMNYFASGRANWVDPRPSIEEERKRREDGREAWVRLREEAHRRGDPGFGP